MKRIAVLIIVIFLLMAGVGWGASIICYVSTTGSNTSPYDTPAKAALLPSTAVTYIEANGDGSSANYIYIADGTYNASGVIISLNSANDVNLSIIGTSRTGTILQSTGTSHTISIGASAVGPITISTLTAKASVADDNRIALTNSNNLGLVATFTNLDLWGKSTSTTSYPYAPGQCSLLTCNNCRFFFGKGEAVRTSSSGGGSLTFNNCISLDGGGDGAGSNEGRWFLQNNGTNLINNTAILDSRTDGLNLNNSTTTLKNCIVSGSLRYTDKYPIRRVSGTVTTSNCLTIQCPYSNPGANTSGTTDTSLYSGQQPGFILPMRGGYIIPCVDDNTGTNSDGSYTLGLETLLASKGMKGSWFMPAKDLTGAILTVAQGVLSRGTMEIGSHAYTHTQMSYTHALHIAYSGAGTNPTRAFDGSTITLNTDGDTDKVTIDTTAANKDTLGEIVGSYGTGNVWTITKSTTDSQDATHIVDSCLASGMAVSGTTTLAVKADLDFDVTVDGTFYTNEYVLSKTTIATAIGAINDPQTGVAYAVNTLASPHDTLSANGKTTLLNNGYWATRGRTTSDSAVMQILNKVDMYNHVCLTYTEIDLSSETTIRSAARAIGFAAAQSGTVIYLLSHHAGEISLTNWGYILDEWSKIANLTVTSAQLMAKQVRTSGLWTDATGGIWTRTYTVTNTSGMRLRPDSAAIRKGISVVGLTTDYAGSPIPQYGFYNIGPYNNQYGGGGLTPGLGLSGNNRPPKRQD